MKSLHRIRGENVEIRWLSATSIPLVLRQETSGRTPATHRHGHTRTCADMLHLLDSSSPSTRLSTPRPPTGMPSAPSGQCRQARMPMSRSRSHSLRGKAARLSKAPASTTASSSTAPNAAAFNPEVILEAMDLLRPRRHRQALYRPGAASATQVSARNRQTLRHRLRRATLSIDDMWRGPAALVPYRANRIHYKLALVLGYRQWRPRKPRRCMASTSCGWLSTCPTCPTKCNR